MQAHTFGSLEAMWPSLTQNAQRVFVLLVRAALDTQQADNEYNNAVSFWQLYRDCKYVVIVVMFIYD